MKAVLPMLVLMVGFTASVSGAQAQDAAGEIAKDAKVVAQPGTGFFPRGGWDGNNVRISVTRSKLLSPGK